MGACPCNKIMPSSSKTTNLKLNQWSGADKPKRADFNADNLNLDNQVGGHIANEALHVTGTDKERWNAPYYINMYTGNDLNSRTFNNLPFFPSAVFIAAAEYPFVQVPAGAAKCTAFSAFATRFAGSMGLTLSMTGQSFTVRETTAAISGNEYASLNKSGVVYLYILFR